MGNNIKQFTCKKLYTDNYEISTYINGVKKDSDIVTLWELDGYMRRLLNDGYAEGYDEGTINEYKAEYETYKELYDMAKANPICKG